VRVWLVPGGRYAKLPAASLWGFAALGSLSVKLAFEDVEQALRGAFGQLTTRFELDRHLRESRAGLWGDVHDGNATGEARKRVRMNVSGVSRRWVAAVGAACAS